MNSKKNIIISLLRIISCFGVFTGHFWGMTIDSSLSYSILHLLRRNFVSNTILSYFYMGDMGVIVFLVIAGFLIPATIKENDDLGKKLCRKCLYILILSYSVVILNAIFSYFYSAYEFNWNNLIQDFKDLILGAKQGYIFYSYQLWFVPILLQGYIICYSFCSIFKQSNIIYQLFSSLCIVILLFTYNCYLSIMFLGCIAYIFMKKLSIFSNIKNTYNFPAILIVFLLSPLAYVNTESYSQIGLAIMIIIILTLSWNYQCKITEKNASIINTISNYTLHFYLIHAFVLKYISKYLFDCFLPLISGRYIELLFVVITYIITFTICIIFSIGFYSIDITVRNAIKKKSTSLL